MKCKFCNNSGIDDTQLCRSHFDAWNKVLNHEGNPLVQKLVFNQSNDECIIIPSGYVTFGFSKTSAINILSFAKNTQVNKIRGSGRTCENKECYLLKHIKLNEITPKSHTDRELREKSIPVVKIILNGQATYECITHEHTPENSRGDGVVFYKGRILTIGHLLLRTHYIESSMSTMRLCQTKHCLNNLHYTYGNRREKEALTKIRKVYEKKVIPVELEYDITQKWKAALDKYDGVEEVALIEISKKYSIHPQTLLSIVKWSRFR